MTAYGYKQTSRGSLHYVRFTPKSRHWRAPKQLGLRKRTLDVRLAPNSRRKWVGRGMSAFDPKRTFVTPTTPSRPGLASDRSERVP